MRKVLIVDLLAERKALGKLGVRKMIEYLPGHEILLWAPHTDERLNYGFGRVVERPESVDLIVITGSRKNVTQWENEWMQELSLLVQSTNTPLLGICFGHQIICHALGGKVTRAEKPSEFITDISINKQTRQAVFLHQEFVIESGEMDVIASSEHAPIAVCRHPTKPIFTVQFHPEADKEVINLGFESGEMDGLNASDFESGKERWNFGHMLEEIDYNVE